MNLDETGATLVSDLVPGFDSAARFLCSLPITMCFLCPVLWVSMDDRMLRRPSCASPEVEEVAVSEI